jgi:hypothetical protein
MQEFDQYIATYTATEFHLDKSPIRALMGPVGCGKSVACCMEIFRIMCSQEPGKDGFRRTKAVCIRNTYPELVTTTIKTWKMLFPTPQTGRVVHGSPTIHYFEWQDIRAEVIFMSLGCLDDIKKLKSLECTVVWLNECQFLFREAIDIALERAKRYPPKSHSLATQNGVILDTNPPDSNHWFFKLFELENPKGYKLFKYEPAIIKINGEWKANPEADYPKNLGEGYDYYLSQIEGKTDEYIKVMFQGQYGSCYSGRHVYPEYNDSLHYDESLKANPELPLILGMDFGLTPAVVIAQYNSLGQLFIIDEITTDYMGLTNFLTDIVIPHFATYYSNFQIETTIGDPAGSQGSQQLTEKTTCFTVLADHGFTARQAKTNKFWPRKEAVSRRLGILVAKGLPALVIGPKAQKIRSGFLGGYHFKEINSTSFGETQYKEEANKNQYSHPHDALQYICLYKESFKTEKIDNKKEKEIMRKLGYI